MTLAVEIVLFFVLLAGFTVTFAALYTTLNQRTLEGSLIRALGASSRQLRLTHYLEYATLGLLAGLIAALASLAVMWSTYRMIFHLDFEPSIWMPVTLMGIGALVIGNFGIFSSRKVLSQSPMSLLRAS